MSRKQLLILLPVLSLLVLAAASQLLLPADSPLVIGRKGKESTAQIPFSAPELTDEIKSTPRRAESGTADSARSDDLQESRRRQAARIEAERQGAPTSGPAATPEPVDRPIQATSEDKPESAPDRTVNVFRDIPRPPGQTLGNLRPRARRIGNTGVKPLSEASERLRQDRRGLYARYYGFQSNPVNTLQSESLEQRTPDIVRIDRQVDFPNKDAWADLPFDLANFAAVWEGFLVIDEPGEYWLFIGADYMAHVQLAGETVLLNNIRDYTEVSAVLRLEAGLHPLRIDYAEGVNGSPVDPLGACRLMYVPAGESQPKPIPPEMLMVPEWMWSDRAPILTRLSRNRGAIGDVITIHGQNLAGITEMPVIGVGERPVRFEDHVAISFSGAYASIVSKAEDRIVVRVPIGAVTGNVVLHRAIAGGWSGSPLAPQPSYGRRIPSNSLRFTVTSQFGLVAHWHNLEGWANYDFIQEGTREPDLVRLEREFMFNSRDELGLPFRNNPLACRWVGKLGIPASTWGADGYPPLIRFEARGGLRVTLGDVTRAAGSNDPPNGGTVQEDGVIQLDFEVFTDQEQVGAERYLPLTIEFTAASDAFVEVMVAHEHTRRIPPQFFFPPVNPPRAPVISHIQPLVAEGELPPQLPYDVLTDKPSIREGQSFEFRLTVFGNDEVKAEAVRVSVDGEPVQYDVVNKHNGRNGEEARTCRGVLPSGLGEGEMRARLGLATSDAVRIDVRNKGLIAYLYDLPNPGGYTQMPDLAPLPCFQVRKDLWVNFENGNDFNLPFPAETFAVEWYGALIVEHEGDYVFTCRSDDGVLVWLNGQLIVNDNSLHYQREKSSEVIRLAPGVYPFKAEFFENNVHEVCVLDWKATRGDEVVVPRQVIPKRNWTWDTHPTLPGKTSTGKRTDGSDP